MQLRLNRNTSTCFLPCLFTMFLAALGCQTVGTTGSLQGDSAIPRSTQPSNAAMSAGVESQPNPSTLRSGVLVMAHGGGGKWNEAVEAVAEPLRKSYPIEIAFGMAKTSTMRAAVDRLEKQGVERIAVVRMFISGESFLDITESILGLRELPDDVSDASEGARAGSAQSQNMTSKGKTAGGRHGMEPPEPLDSDAVFVLSPEGVSTSPLVDDILFDRVMSLSVNPSRESVLILAHGPGDDGQNIRWLADMNHRTERLRASGGFRDVHVDTLREDWPQRRSAARKRIREYVQTHSDSGERVIVVPFRIAGFGPYADVLQNLEYVADGRGFCPHPMMTRWIDQTARAAVPSLPEPSILVERSPAD